MKRKIISGVLALFLTLCILPTTISDSYAAVTGDWTTFRGDTTGNAVVNSQTPIDKNKTKALWDDEISTANYIGGTPLLVGDSLYLATGKELRKYNKNTGSLNKSWELPLNIEETTRMVYSDGIVYLPVQTGSWMNPTYSTSIMAVNTNSEVVETLATFDGLQSISTLTHNDGKLFVGLTNGSNAGKLVCLDSTDGSTIWEFDNGSGYYWAGGVVMGKYFVIAGDDGNLFSIEIAKEFNDKKAVATDTKELGGQFRSSIVADGNDIYFTSTSCKLYKVTVDPDTGAFSAEVNCTLSGSTSTNTVVINGDNVYAFSGAPSFSSDDMTYLSVLDKNSLSVKRTASWAGYSQSSPLLTTGYASGDYPVYLYMMINSSPGDLIAIKDDGKSLTKSTVYSNGGEYSMDSAVADSDGTLYVVTPNKMSSDWVNYDIKGKIVALTIGAPNDANSGGEKTETNDDNSGVNSESDDNQLNNNASNGGDANESKTNDEINLVGLLVLMCIATIAGIYMYRRGYVLQNK